MQIEPTGEVAFAWWVGNNHIRTLSFDGGHTMWVGDSGGAKLHRISAPLLIESKPPPREATP